jgi:predicted dehydrogenase
MSANTTFSRRQILKGATLATAAGTLGPFFPGRVLGANDRINAAVVGFRGRGGSIISGLGKIAGVQIKTLCDIDENVGMRAVKETEERYKLKPGFEWDMRRVFDDKDIDVVGFGTPNHWHALGSIWAAQAKKHVYVEKPACQTIHEGRQMVNAARKYGVLMQVGFQNRSRRNTTAAVKFLQEGKLGKLYMARGLCYKPRVNIGRYPDGPQGDNDKVPPGAGNTPFTKAYLDKVHYDLWIGPAPQKPFNANRFHYNWHWQWDYGNGDTGNQGPHQFDVGRWGLGREDYPVRVRSYGGLYSWADTQQETPNTQTTILEYADGTIFEFATRGLPTNKDGDVKIGVIFYGSEGRLEMDDGGNWQTFMGPKGEPGPNSKNIKEEASDSMNLTGGGDSGHFGNFIEAVRANKMEKLTCDIEVGYKSSVLPLMANVSYRVKRELKWDAKKEQFAGDADANKLLHRKDRKGFEIPNLMPRA